MAPQTLETCAELKLSVANENDQKVERLQRAQWLRAAILGANDGLVSTTSLMLGVSAAKDDRWNMLLSGFAGAVAGACSMALGEFVSVSTQRDIEKDCNQKSETQLSGPDHGVKLKPSTTLATILGTKISTNSPTETPSRKIQAGKETSELSGNASPALTPRTSLPVMSPGRSPVLRAISEDAKRNQTMELPEKDYGTETLPNPVKAAAASGLSFLCGSLVPLASTVFVSEHNTRIILLVVVTSITLALFGGIGALLGGSPVRTSALRVLIGGLIAMAITYGLLKPLEGVDRHEHEE